VLYIRNNRIESLPSGIFNSLTSLLHLYFSDNMLQEVTNDSTGLSDLIRLDLARNQLDGIPNLQSSKSLSSIYFEYNNITNIAAESFAGLNELTLLNLR
uniref:Chaoptin n=1 Tax=Strigamia maritima TaxID=126957 RepID=T1IZL6_STRMM